MTHTILSRESFSTRPQRKVFPVTDVYAGLVLDYKGRDVTPANWMTVLTGDRAEMQDVGAGRMINSTDGGNLFVCFAGHWCARSGLLPRRLAGRQDTGRGTARGTAADAFP